MVQGMATHTSWEARCGIVPESRPAPTYTLRPATAEDYPFLYAFARCDDEGVCGADLGLG